MDIPLNETGIAQAEAAAALLRGRGIASIVSSPLSRAKDTADAVGRALGLPVTVIDGLKEVAFGEREGAEMAGEWFAEWVAGVATPARGESFAALRSRAVAAVTEGLGYAAPVLVVAHGALFRALRAEMGLEVNMRTPNAVPLFCQPGTPWALVGV